MEHIFPDKNKGFTLVEILLTVFLGSLLATGIFYVYSATESSRILSAAKIEVQSEVRRTMDWIVNDLRQTTTASITDTLNVPPSSSTHIKFKKVAGYSVKGGIPSPDFGNFIDYTFDAANSRLIRTEAGGSPGIWQFNNIVNQVEDSATHVMIDRPIFNTRLLNGTIVPLAPGIVITAGNLVVEITGRKEAQLPQGPVEVVYSLKEEVSMRN